MVKEQSEKKMRGHCMMRSCKMSEKCGMSFLQNEVMQVCEFYDKIRKGMKTKWFSILFFLRELIRYHESD